MKEDSLKKMSQKMPEIKCGDRHATVSVAQGLTQTSSKTVSLLDTETKHF